jgi:DNA-binding transcriptional ArsR family regulator
MPGDVDIASVAALLAEPTRAAMLLALSDGRAFTTNELARSAKVAPSTASEHLARLLDSSLLVVEKQGRNRFYRLADPTIVEIMENLARLAPQVKIRSLGESERARAVRRARMCYNHLAGTLGVSLTEALVEKRILHSVDTGYVIEGSGINWLEDFGIPCQPLTKRGLLFVPWHIDWSERKHHVAGAFGAALTRHLFDLNWVKRQPSSRSVHLTPAGQAGLEQTFSLHL